MPDDKRGKTGRLNRPVTGNLPDNNAVQIFYHQRRTEGLSQYALMVVPLLKAMLSERFNDPSDYGVDDNIDVDSAVVRYGWRIFRTAAPAQKFSVSSDMPMTSTRKTILAVELLFSDNGHPVAFLVDTRRTRTSIKTGLLGLKQRTQVTEGMAKKTALTESALDAALKEVIKTIEV